MKTWKDVLTVVVKCLVKQRLLSISNCPVTLSRASSRYSIGASPKHKSGKNFIEPVNVQDMWVETNANAMQLAKSAQFLMNKFAKGSEMSVAR